MRHGPRGDFVWVVRENMTVEPRPVAAREGPPGRMLIERGLTAGEQVVIDGHFLLESGAKVEIIRSAPLEPPARPRVASDGT